EQWHRDRAAEAQIQHHAPSLVFHIDKLMQAGVASGWETRQAAWALADSHRWHEADVHFAAAVQKRPRDWRLRVEHARGLMALGRWDSAAEECKSALSLQPGRGWLRGDWWIVGPFHSDLTQPLPPDLKIDLAEPIPVTSAPQSSGAEELYWRLTNATGPWV